VKRGRGALFSQLRYTPPKQRTYIRSPKARVVPLRSFIEISDDEEDVGAFDSSEFEYDIPTPPEPIATKSRLVGGFRFGNLDDAVLSHRLRTKATLLIRALVSVKSFILEDY
jgi:hypothetical protein